MRNVLEKDRARELEKEDVERMNIGELHWEVTFEAIPDFQYKKIIGKFISGLADHVQSGRGLLLWGPYGSGKTAIGALLCKETAKRRGTAFMVSAMDLADLVIGKEWFDKDETVAQRLISVDVLVIDELGGGQGEKSGWSKSYIEKVVRTRTRQKRTTICISNLDMPTLKEMYGDGLLAIMAESVYPVKVAGHNWRESKRQDLKRIFED
jgi:DNA replication protein DnaC